MLRAASGRSSLKQGRGMTKMEGGKHVQTIDPPGRGVPINIGSTTLSLHRGCKTGICPFRVIFATRASGMTVGEGKIPKHKTTEIIGSQ